MTTKIDNVAFINNSGVWPQWPYLPVKNYSRKEPDGFPKLGVVVEKRGGGASPTVFLINLFDLPDLYESGKTLNDCDKMEYDSVTAMVADGWEVD